MKSSKNRRRNLQNDPTSYKEPIFPKCPECGKAPISSNHAFQSYPSTKAMYSLVWCVDCGAIISLQYIGQNQAVEVVQGIPKGIKMS